MKIENITVDSTSIKRCYKKYYPEYYESRFTKNKFHYLDLWGIRMSTCDSSKPDDLVGGIRVNNLNFHEIIISTASTDPSPSFIAKPMSGVTGGTAFVKEGQYAFRYMYRRNGQFSPYPSWCPIKPMDVYRWIPSSADIAAWKKGQKGLSASFEDAVKSGRVTLSKSPDTCIHRAWNSEKLINDSAGCQVLTDMKTLSELGTWSEKHINKKYGNSFIYTLFTKQQFVEANEPDFGLIYFQSLFK